ALLLPRGEDAGARGSPSGRIRHGDRIHSVVVMDIAPQTITVEGLTRRFGDLTAVDHVDFSVEKGLMTGFVGGNGAGKTTTMRMIMGVLGISEGRVLWGGRPITTADQRALGHMPDE